MMLSALQTTRLEGSRGIGGTPWWRAYNLEELEVPLGERRPCVSRGYNNIQYTIYNIQYTIYNIQYTIYNIQYTIYNTIVMIIYNITGE